MTKKFEPAPLQQLFDFDEQINLSVSFSSFAKERTKSGTLGFHHRRIPISKIVRRLRQERATDHIAQCAHKRVEDAGTFARQVLFPPVLAVFTGAPGENERRRDDDTARERANRVVANFDRLVDLDFFDDLDAELAVYPDEQKAAAEGGRWLFKLRDQGRDVLESAISAAPKAAMRHWRVQVKARDIFEGCFAKQFRSRIPDDVWAQHTQRAADPAAHEEQNAKAALPMEADHDA